MRTPYLIVCPRLVTIYAKRQWQDTHKYNLEGKKTLANNVHQLNGQGCLKECTEGLPKALPAI